MWSEVINLAVQSGIFAVLFCALLIYDLKVTGKREQKYQKTISALTDALCSLQLLKGQIEECERLLESISDCMVAQRPRRRRQDATPQDGAVDVAE